MNRISRFAMLAVLALQAGLAGCSSCPSIRAAWYRMKPVGGDTETVMLAVVNEGSADIELLGLKVNPGGRENSDGWSPKPRQTPEVLAVGQVRVYDVMAFEDPKRNTFRDAIGCRLPVALTYTCDASSKRYRATIEGKMPNYLPDEWVRDCRN